MSAKSHYNYAFPEKGKNTDGEGNTVSGATLDPSDGSSTISQHRRKAPSIGAAEVKMSEMASPVVKSIGSFIYSGNTPQEASPMAGSTYGSEAGINSNEADHHNYHNFPDVANGAAVFSVPPPSTEAAGLEPSSASSPANISVSNVPKSGEQENRMNLSANSQQRDRKHSILTTSHLEQMDAFASESPDNLRVVLPDIFERIGELLLTYPDSHQLIWDHLKPILEEENRRLIQLHGGESFDQPETPIPVKRPVTFTNHHGDEMKDDFSYFKDRNDEQEENDYASKALENTNVLQKVLYQEFVSHHDETETSPRTSLGDNYTYYTKRVEGQEYQIHCRCETNNPESTEEVFLDENELFERFTKANDGEAPKFFNIGFVHYSPTFDKICYAVDLMGNERYSIYFKDLKTGEEYVDECIVNVSDSGCHFSNDGKYAFYLLLDETERAWNLKRHQLGTSVSSDISLIEETDEMFFLTLTRSGDGKFLFINASAQITSQTWYIPADHPLDPPRVVFERARHVNYICESHGNFFYVLTNQGVKNNYLFRVPFPDRLGNNDPVVQVNAAEIVVEHRDFVLIESFQVRARHLIVLERSNCLQNVRVMELDPNTGLFSSYHYISFSELVYSIWLGTITDEAWDLSKQALFNTNILRFTYSSFVQPKQVLDYDMDSRTLTIVHEQKVRCTIPGLDSSNNPNGNNNSNAANNASSSNANAANNFVYYKPDRYVQKRLFATGIDGTAIPISLVYRKDLLRKDQDQSSNPCLLYSYGAYGMSLSPIFNSNRLSLLDRGFIYALAHVRGGADMGNAWYLEGKLDKKPNTFNDFISCAEFLVKEGYTNQDKLAIYGRSAGGLLIGAVVNKRPDLFKAVLTEVPFVDVINTMFDSSIPWVAFEYEEWGNPIDPKIYNVMKTYCPYSNVPKATTVANEGEETSEDNEGEENAVRKSEILYPNMLVVAGMNDPRVAYFEPAKWVAKLRSNLHCYNYHKAGNRRQQRLLIMKVDDVGHGGSSGRYSHLEELAYEYAFLISCLKAPYRPIPVEGDSATDNSLRILYKKIERDEFERNYLQAHHNTAGLFNNPRSSTSSIRNWISNGNANPYGQLFNNQWQLQNMVLDQKRERAKQVPVSPTSEGGGASTRGKTVHYENHEDGKVHKSTAPTNKSFYSSKKEHHGHRREDNNNVSGIEDKDASSKSYRKAPNQLYQWISNLF